MFCGILEKLRIPLFLRRVFGVWEQFSYQSIGFYLKNPELDAHVILDIPSSSKLDVLLCCVIFFHNILIANEKKIGLSSRRFSEYLYLFDNNDSMYINIYNIKYKERKY